MNAHADDRVVIIAGATVGTFIPHILNDLNG